MNAPLHPLVALWKAISFDIHPWAFLSILLAQFMLTVFALVHGLTARSILWKFALLTITCALIPVIIIQVCLLVSGGKEYVPVAMRLSVFYFFAVPAVAGVFLTRSPHRKPLLLTWFWAVTMLWMLPFLLVGGWLMIIGPGGILLFLVLYLLHRKLVRALSTYGPST